MCSLSNRPAKTFIIALSLLLLMVLTGCKSSATGSLDAEPTNNSNNGGGGGGGGGGTNTPGSLTWDAPTTNTDGSSIAGLEGYKIYYGTSSGFYTGVLDVGNVTTYTVNNLSLPSGAYYVAVTTYDSSGNESDFSNESSITIP